MSARLETHCRLILASIAYSNSLVWGLNTGCSYLHHFNDYCITSSRDNNKMTFNNGFLVHGNGGTECISDHISQCAAFVSRFQMENKTIISMGVTECFFFFF